MRSAKNAKEPRTQRKTRVWIGGDSDAVDEEIPPYWEPDRELDELAHRVIGAAIEVHKRLGAGLDEASYAKALQVELAKRGIQYRSEVWVDILYKDVLVGKRRIDLIVDDRLIVELKSVDTLIPLFTAQTLTYLRLTRLKLALIINFNTVFLKDGIKRVLRSGS